MSLGWTTYVAPEPLPKGLKTQNGRFPSKCALHLKKVCYYVSLCINCQRQSRKAFSSLISVQKWFMGTSPSMKIWPKLSHPFKNADFQSIFARITSAVTPSDKSSIITNKKSTTSFPMSLRWALYVALKPPRERSSKMQCDCFSSKIWHRWPWMTLNGAVASVLRYVTELVRLRGRLRNSG